MANDKPKGANDNLHPLMQGVFDMFLASCAEDTVNNGDTLLTKEEWKREQEREALEDEERYLSDRGWADEGSGLVADPEED